MASNLTARKLKCWQGEHEHDMVGRFLQRLEERVESCVGDLVGFVEDVDFETVASGTVTGGFAEFADFIDTAVRGGIDFDDINRVARPDFGAGFADAARFGDRTIFGAAVQGHG